jgi:hypothetical protein
VRWQGSGCLLGSHGFGPGSLEGIRLTAERRQIAAVLAELPTAVGDLRAALTPLAAIVGG